ncbi:hypothetical protein AURDEDRAFT_177411 [Auricularia subglabra TFB-10046 SS5]|uniref:Uncharacterized protein n=1 Tax=Auricularia subglabra (strain TFB-10046 / SS5) TaxID=717982 RepID=J0WMD7_AURST|nr:hypothetical protein AURDEDRAFT_177411 [Auricularia subglabra TFB-10046 SS5]
MTPDVTTQPTVKATDMERSRRGPKTGISKAIVDWGFPLIVEYGQMKCSGKAKEAKAFKARMLQEFDDDTHLSKPMDQVHLDFYPVTETVDTLKKRVHEWFLRTERQSWDSGDLWRFRLAQAGATASPDVAAAAQPRAQTTLDAFRAANKSEIKQRMDELMDKELDDADDADERRDARLQYHSRAAKELYDALDADAKAAYEAEARASKAAADSSKDSVEMIESHRDQLVKDLQKVLRRVRGGYYGIAVMSTEVAFYDHEKKQARTWCFSNARFDLSSSGYPMWKDSESYEDAFVAFKEHAKAYIAGCVAREEKGKTASADLGDVASPDTQARQEVSHSDRPEPDETSREDEETPDQPFPPPHARRHQQMNSLGEKERATAGELETEPGFSTDDLVTRDESPPPTQTPRRLRKRSAGKELGGSADDLVTGDGFPPATRTPRRLRKKTSAEMTRSTVEPEEHTTRTPSPQGIESIGPAATTSPYLAPANGADAPTMNALQPSGELRHQSLDVSEASTAVQQTDDTPDSANGGTATAASLAPVPSGANTGGRKNGKSKVGKASGSAKKSGKSGEAMQPANARGVKRGGQRWVA